MGTYEILRGLHVESTAYATPQAELLLAVRQGEKGGAGYCKVCPLWLLDCWLLGKAASA